MAKEFQIAVYRGARRTPKRNFLKEVPLWTLFKNFQKGLFNNDFLKVLGVLRTLFQKGSKPPEAALPLSSKPKFEPERS